jgi:hypothetical protein
VSGPAHPIVVPDGGLTRQSFLLRSALAVGAAYGAAAVGPHVRAAFAAPETTDVSIVDFALNLEYLEDAFYAEALQRAPLSGEAEALATVLSKNEDAHVKALIATLNDLGADAPDSPGFEWGDSFKSEATFLKRAVYFEDIGVSAYNGAAPMIQDKEILAAAGGIVQVEARHAALLRGMTGQPPTVAAFDQTLSQAQVLDEVAAYLRE